MKKIVKFKKDHVAGFKKDDVRQLNKNTAERMIAEGYAVESTEKEYLKFKESQSKLTKGTALIEEAKANVNAHKECEGCKGKEADEVECEECRDKKKGNAITLESEETNSPGTLAEKKYHILTQEDIDANEEFAVGLEVGDEVEENEEGELVVGEDGLLVKKK